MEKQYHLRSIKHNRTSDYLSVSASLYLEHRRIGSLKTCPDTEAFIIDFELPTDRIVFENFLVDWWSRNDRTAHFGLIEKTIKSATPSYGPPMTVKLRCWIKSLVEPVGGASMAHNAAVDLTFA
jgi:hypothetical protein